ncbi:hypothetical protein BG011_004071 [Mortierella polycephala]|uniref:Uncharacterized protein n=1 Tax=Mortierella polycephala TaxID=41804 RepID=A0A9P6PZK2_9FUNG|nr:hypothetical protein BG011_004071 [Mortierella polycephala]
MVTASAKKNLIITASAVVGLTTVSTIAYLLIQDDRRAKHQRKVRTLQKSLTQKLVKVETSVQSIIEGDIRLAQVRTRTLRTYPIYPGDPDVQLPSLGLINKQDEIDLGEIIEETPDELIREREMGFSDDSKKVRQGYKKLEYLSNSVNEQLLRLLESLDAISPRELTDLGDVNGGIPLTNGPEVAAFEKIRKRKRADITKIQLLMAQMDKITACFKDRMVAIEAYEKKLEEEAEAAAIAAKEEAKKKEQEQEQEEKEKEKEMANGHHHDHANDDLVKEGMSFADIVSQNIPEPEILEQTEDLEKMKEGVTFAEVVSQNTQIDHHDHHEHSATTTKTTMTTTTTTTSTVHAEHSEKVQGDISFADVVSNSCAVEDKVEVEEDKVEVKGDKAEIKDDEVEVKDEEVLEPTEDLEKMKQGITFADAVSSHVEETDAAPEVSEELKAKTLVEETPVAEVAAAH